MKKLTKILLFVIVLSLCLAVLVGCSKDCGAGMHKFDKKTGICSECGKKCCDVGEHKYVNGVCTLCKDQYEFVDYVDQCKLDMSSKSAKYTANGIIKMYIDGDTTHFNVPTTIDDEGTLKARYLAVNTPESTGQIEPYGKIASNYTKDKLSKAAAVLIESDSDDGKWNNDSYGRFLIWVWYKETATGDWRNLNLELLQNGYGYGSNPRDNRYGEYCVAALAQAIDAKLICHSQLKDETFYYGEAKEITLKELRTNPETYDGVRVAFEGDVTNYYNGSSYVQWYCEEDNLYYGISVYYNGSNSTIKEALSVGSHVRVVCKASQFNGTWQVSSITYNDINESDPNNTVLLEANVDFAIREMTIPEFNSNKKVSVYNHEKEADEDKTFKTAELIVDTAVKMVNLYVDHTYTTDSGTSKGAMSLYCVDADGNEITVRTEKLWKLDEASGKYVLATADEFDGQTITVQGVVDHYNYNNHNEYQIRVLSYDDIEIVAD